MGDPTYTPVKLEIEGLGITVGIDIDAGDNIYVANRKSKRILRLPASGPIETLPIDGLVDPYGVKVDDAGRILVADYGQHQVIRFDPSTGNREVLGFTDLRFPSDVAVDAEGRILAVDSGHYRVVRLSSSGEQEALGTTEIRGIHGIALDSSGTIYVTQKGAGPEGVFKYGPDGEPTKFATYGLDGPAGIVIGRDGTIYVANGGQAQHSSTIARFKPDGTRLTPIKTCEPLSGEPCVMRPLAIALDSAENITAIGYQPEAIRLIKN
ncbi:hypothetical protein ACFZC5_18115 [Nocardia gamkensis]|uniref:hypothetical protein n=1 Tax=Nocardia gamkensis TaxID=352869 RepID=UPI0036E1D696